MDYQWLFLKSLALTILIESIVLTIFFRFVVKSEKLSIYRLLFTGFVASFATLPYLWFILPGYIDLKVWYIIIGESFAILFESIVISAMLRTRYRISLISSLTCNLISFGTGLLINWP